MSIIVLGQAVYEPVAEDTDEVKFLYQWLERYQLLAGSEPYRDILRQYLHNRIEWETEDKQYEEV